MSVSRSYVRRQRPQIFIVTAFAPKIDSDDLLTALTTLIDPAKDLLIANVVDARLVRYGPKDARTALEEFMKRHGDHADDKGN